MVKVGFIVEGTSDLIILKSDYFQKLYKRLNLNVQNDFFRVAKGKSTLKTNFKSFVASLKKEVQFIFLLVDQDNDECPLKTKNDILTFKDNRHYNSENLIFISMTREIEAWFLADEKLKFNINNPENEGNPSLIMENIYQTKSHVKIAHRVKKTFSLERATKNSKSAKRFLNKLKKIKQLSN